MPLYRRRRKQQEKAERQSRGEPMPLTELFTPEARNGLLYAIWDNTPQYLVTGSSAPDSQDHARLIRQVLTRDWEALSLVGESDAADDLNNLVAISGDTDQLLDVIEAVFVVFEDAKAVHGSWYAEAEVATFRERVNEILDDHDLAFQVVGNEIVPRESMVMHADVVAPVMSLLHGNPALMKVEEAFHDALQELKPGGKAADAITDAARALQEMLGALGAEGNALGPLLASARKRELLGPHDTKLVEGVEKIGEWVSADRSSRGDAHVVTDADRDDAWLAVHVVGALVLRLEKRLSSGA